LGYNWAASEADQNQIGVPLEKEIIPKTDSTKLMASLLESFPGDSTPDPDTIPEPVSWVVEDLSTNTCQDINGNKGNCDKDTLSLVAPKDYF